VIRQDGDEVGVFLRQDSLDLPYEPTNMESKKAGNQTSKVQQSQHNNPTPSTSGTHMERKIMYLTLKTRNKIYGDEKSTMILVPLTYHACQAAAYNAFKNDLLSLYVQKQDDVILQVRHGEFWSVVTPEAYSFLVSTGGDRIDNLWVDGTLR